jgi:hypothetical protein
MRTVRKMFTALGLPGEIRKVIESLPAQELADGASQIQVCIQIEHGQGGVDDPFTWGLPIRCIWPKAGRPRPYQVRLPGFSPWSMGSAYSPELHEFAAYTQPSL